MVSKLQAAGPVTRRDDIRLWSAQDVASWAMHTVGVSPAVARILLGEEITGAVLVDMTAADLRSIGVKFGPAATLVVKARNSSLWGTQQTSK
jgi:hypothetical protein